ncbi:MAG: 3'-5' exonuclease [Oscillospiraceae bacterium]
MLLHFEADHPGAKVLFLEQNYRSTPQIVEAADRFIRQNVSRRDKHMQPVRSGGAAIRQIPLNRRERQYTYLLEVARDLPENTAVLYRDHDSALPLIDLLERNGVPYRAKQTDGTFFSSRIVRDITDIIRFAQSPWDGALFRRIYYKFCAGIPKAVAERAAAHNPTAEPLLLAVADDDVSPYTRRQCRMLQTHLQNLRTEKANRAVYRIVAFMGYGDYLDQCGADKSRAEILEALGAQEPDPLRLLERLDELQALLRQPKSEARGLILSTVHSSKGLEYDRVFLLDVIDGVFPKEGEDVDRDEERRLFYVAMTRARNELAVFTFPPEKTSSAFSQFLFRPKRRIPRKSKKKTAADSFLPGTPVQHSAYGAGRILAREGDRVRIRFSSGSERVFSLAAAVPNGLLSLRQESGGNAATD